MKCVCKYVTIEAVKDKKLFTLLFLDWVGKRGAIETAKMHGFKAVSSKAGTVEAEFELEDCCEATLSAEFGAMIPHDLSYDAVASSFDNFNSGVIDNGN